jgi:hypothetical protein
MTTANFNNKTISGRAYHPAAPRQAGIALPPGYMAHANGASFIVSLGDSFLYDVYGRRLRFATVPGMQDYCRKHAGQGLRSHEVPS